MIGRRGAEQPAAGSFPDRYDEAVADTDLRLRRPAVFLEARMKALGRQREQGSHDIVVDVDEVEAREVVLDLLALDVARGRAGRRQ